MRYYFTYGTSDSQPFKGGWTEVDAPDIFMACKLFRAVHPDRTESVLNCSSVYDEEEFSQTSMSGPGGSLGHKCHERITLERFPNA